MPKSDNSAKGTYKDPSSPLFIAGSLGDAGDTDLGYLPQYSDREVELYKGAGQPTHPQPPPPPLKIGGNLSPDRPN
jgi:hypothetical protein